MEQREIEIFLTLAEELHFGRTAERLHVSTTRVSQTIRKVERQIGVPLFERTSRRVVLTPIGRHLEEGLRPAFQQTREAIARAIAAGRGVDGELVVGFIGTVVGRFLHSVGEAFQARHPACQIQIREARYSDFLGLLRSGELDLALVPFLVEEPDLVSGPVLFSEPTVLAVSARHPFARRKSVTLEDLARDKVLHPASVPEYMKDALAPRTTPSGKPIERGPDFSTVQEMLSLIGAGQGMFPVPVHATRYDTRPDIVYVPISDGVPRKRVLIWRASGETSRIRAFTRTAQVFVAANGDPLGPDPGPGN
jgi:DNA-binding transcriptional LysR family regulator